MIFILCHGCCAGYRPGVFSFKRRFHTDSERIFDLWHRFYCQAGAPIDLGYFDVGGRLRLDCGYREFCSSITVGEKLEPLIVPAGSARQ
jgi:hypothetical protein